MPMTWRIGNRVRLNSGTKERTYTVQKVIVIKRHGLVFRRGIHRYLIKDNQTGQLREVTAESLRHA